MTTSKTNKVRAKAFTVKLCVTTFLLAPQMGHAQMKEHAHNMDMTNMPMMHHANHPKVPLGVMGANMHKRGQWMLSYRYMGMRMNGNINGSDDIDDQTLVTTIPNSFSAMPGQPATLRIAPQTMRTDMHMFGAMYAPTDDLNLMAMINYYDKQMTMNTYQGGAGTTVLGSTKTTASGFGDLKLGGMYRLHDHKNHHFHLNFGLSVPTGSIEKRGRMLTPMGSYMDMRLPYGMQLGSGTYDFLPGLTYKGNKHKWSWGAQYHGELRLESQNSQGYALGDKHSITAWGAHAWTPEFTTSLRVDATHQDSIKGQDRNIMGPAQGADPKNYGGTRVNVLLGLNYKANKGSLAGHQISAEFGVPIHQKVNGVQMKSDYSIRVGWQKMF